MGKLSLVVPVYNEQFVLSEVLVKYIADLENVRNKFGYDWEVVAVDDCSADESRLILMKFARRYPNFRIVNLANRSGKHAAVTAGLAQARGDLVLTAEIDIQNPMGLFENLVREHLESGIPIIYGYQQFTGWRRRKAFITDRLTRFACRLFLLDGYFTGIVNAELYTADVVAIMRANPAKTKYMRTMNNWVGWQSKEYWYACEYTPEEAKLKMAQLHHRHQDYQHFKKTGHVNAANNWLAVLFLLLAVTAFVTVGIFAKVTGVLFITLMCVAGSACLVLAVLTLLRTLLTARLGKVNYRPGEIVYEIKSILNK